MKKPWKTYLRFRAEGLGFTLKDSGLLGLGLSSDEEADAGTVQDWIILSPGRRVPTWRFMGVRKYGYELQVSYLGPEVITNTVNRMITLVTKFHDPVNNPKTPIIKNNLLVPFQGALEGTL